MPGRSTLCEARQRLGVAPLVRLAKSVVHLLARPATRGCFYQGLRLMTVDAFVVNLPDMPATDRVFSRPKNGRGYGAFPQARVLGLMEAGTHVFWKWLIKDCAVDETRMLGSSKNRKTNGPKNAQNTAKHRNPKGDSVIPWLYSGERYWPRCAIRRFSGGTFCAERIFAARWMFDCQRAPG